MNKMLVALFMLSLSTQVFAYRKKVRYEITITNLTKGQPLTPPVLVLSNHKFELFSLGKKASIGLQELAKDGKQDELVAELKQNMNVKMVVKGTSLILPGQSVSFKVEAPRRSVLSLASMLAKTNDAFVAIKNLHLRHASRLKGILLKTYDAGAEINNESKKYIPGLGSPGADTETEEGFVHFHPGIYGIADLSVLTDTFNNHAAKIEIRKLH